MAIELLLGLVVFAAVTCFTPGPNNTMLMASGLNFGALRSVPHVLGVTFGFGLMVLLVGLGIGEIFKLWPAAFSVLRVAAVVYLLWLAWAIATAGGLGEPARQPRPMSFLEAAAFQWVNPKGWIMALGATTTFVFPGGPLASSAVSAAVFVAVGFFSSGGWALLGAGLRRLLDDPARLRWINLLLAALLVASLYPTIGEIWGEIAGQLARPR